MIRVYYLETERIANTDTVNGIQYIHDAILGVEGILRVLIQDTTVPEHNFLIAIAKSWRAATAAESTLLATLPPPAPPARNLAAELDALRSQVNLSSGFVS